VLITGILDQAINGISTVIGLGMAVISAVWGLGWHAIETFFVAIWHAIVEMFHVAVDELYQTFVAMPLKIIGYIEKLKQMVYDWATGVMVHILSGLATGWNAVYKWVSGLPGQIINAIGSVASMMGNIGQNIVTGLWNGIVGMSSWLLQKLENWAKNLIPGWLKTALGIGSPSKVMADQIGQWIPAGIAVGIDQGAHHVATSMKKIAGIATGTNFAAEAGQFGGGVNSFAGAGGAGGAGGVVNVFMSVQGTVIAERDLMDKVQSAFLQAGLQRGITYQGFKK
jgi:phage-related protein